MGVELEGNDTLNGGSGKPLDIDTLNGGNGVDRYVFGAGYNRATILDADGQGVIEVNGTVLSGGQLKGESLWISEDSAWRYTRMSNGDLHIAQRTTRAPAPSPREPPPDWTGLDGWMAWAAAIRLVVRGANSCSAAAAKSCA